MITNAYTPYAHLTDGELALHIANLPNPTDLDIEVMLRIERLTEEVEALTTRQGKEPGDLFEVAA